MTDQDYRHYVLIVDRSGSMETIKDDAQGGINQFVKDQAALPGKATLSLYQFDTEHEKVHDFTTLSEAGANYTLKPRGGTALLDACGFAITQEGEKLAKMLESQRPGKVIVLITTDGEENSSHEYTKDRVKKLITGQQDDYGWQFSYVGANQDAFAEAGGLGIAPGAALNYAASGIGTNNAYAAASAASSRYVGGQSAFLAYTDDEREEAQKED